MMAEQMTRKTSSSGSPDKKKWWLFHQKWGLFFSASNDAEMRANLSPPTVGWNPHRVSIQDSRMDG
jgi:hypothetical protein